MRIVAAALRKGMLIVSAPPPARHGDLMRSLYAINKRISILPSEQGFLTSEGRFVTRPEAFLIAEAAGQLLGEPPRGDLYSEDVW